MGPRVVASLSLLLAAAAGGLLWLSSQDIGGHADPGTASPSASPKPPKDVACPAGTPTASAAPAEDPVVVRLCGDGAPADALTEGTRAVVAGLASCPSGHGASYALAYADRSTASLPACPPYDAFGKALWRQRGHETPPKDVHAPRTCPTEETTSLVADAHRMALARLCLADGTHRGTPVPAGDVRTIVHDWAGGGAGRAMAPLSCGSNRDWRLYGVTAWGDPVGLASVCGLYTDDSGRFWHPTPSVLDLLGHLEAEAR